MSLVLLACLIVAAACGYAWAHGIVYAGRTQAGWTTVHRAQLEGETIRVLEVADTYQSATYLDERWCDPVFPYHHLFEHLFDAWPHADGPTSIAVLGGGGYAIPRHLVAHHPEVRRIDVVELDPAIQRIARRHFYLDRLERRFGAEAAGRLNLVVGDAAVWLRESRDTYDAIINDCFLGLEPEHELMTAEAAQLVAAHLTPDGVYLTNVVSALQGSEARLFRQQVAALSATFSHVWLYPCGADEPQMPDNNVILATNADHVFVGALSCANLEELMP